MTWEMVPLPSVAEIQGGLQKSGKRRATPDNAWPFLRVANVTAHGLDLREVHTIAASAAEAEKIQLRRGDLLVVEGNGSANQIGRAAVWQGSIENCLHQNHLIRVRPNQDQIDPRYLGIVWNSPQLREHLTRVASSSSGLHTLSVSKLKRLEVPLPDLPNQRRIVELIEEHLSHLDAADAALDSARTRAQTLGSAALQQIVSEVEGDSQLVNLGELARISSGTTPSRGNKSFWENGLIPWITSGDLSAEDIYEARQWVTTAALETTSLKMLPSGTLLVAMYGEGKTRGTVAELHIPATINQACAAIQLHEPAVRSWVRLVLEANYSAMRKLAVGGVQPNLNQGLIRNIPIPLPEPDLRQAVLARADVLRSGAARLQTQADTAKARSATLRHAVLAAAFSGRLTGSSSDSEVIEATAKGFLS